MKLEKKKDKGCTIDIPCRRAGLPSNLDVGLTPSNIVVGLIPSNMIISLAPFNIVDRHSFRVVTSGRVISRLTGGHSWREKTWCRDLPDGMIGTMND